MGGKRINIERQKELEPKRVTYAVEQITKLGYEITSQSSTEINFFYKGKKVRFYPYSGWHTGGSIKDGRGIEKLLAQIKEPAQENKITIGSGNTTDDLPF